METIVDYSNRYVGYSVRFCGHFMMPGFQRWKVPHFFGTSKRRDLFVGRSQTQEKTFLVFSKGNQICFVFFSFYLFIFFLHFSIFIWRGGLLYLSVARWVCVCFVFGPLRDCSFFMFVWFNEIAHSRILPLHFSLFSSSLILGESCACALFGEAAAAALGSILLILTISCMCSSVCLIYV